MSAGEEFRDVGWGRDRCPAGTETAPARPVPVQAPAVMKRHSGASPLLITTDTRPNLWRSFIWGFILPYTMVVISLEPPRLREATFRKGSPEDLISNGSPMGFHLQGWLKFCGNRETGAGGTEAALRGIPPLSCRASPGYRPSTRL